MLDIYRRFGTTCRSLLQGPKKSQGATQNLKEAQASFKPRIPQIVHILSWINPINILCGWTKPKIAILIVPISQFGF
jgi:hypothetical protein